MAGAEREHPAGRRAAARDRHHHAVEGRDVDLEAAEAPRLQEPVEAALAEDLVQLLRVAGSLLGRGLLLEQPRPERVGLREELVGVDQTKPAGSPSRSRPTFVIVRSHCRPMCVRITVSASMALADAAAGAGAARPAGAEEQVDGFRRRAGCTAARAAAAAASPPPISSTGCPASNARFAWSR